MHISPRHSTRNGASFKLLTCVTALILTFAAVVPLQSAGYFQSLGGEIQIPSPEGWQLGSDSLIYPFQFVHEEPVAELLIFKSTIETGDLIRDDDDLRQSVDVIIEDVILQMPGARLTTSSGFFDGYRTGFVIEFTSIDSVSGQSLQHRFCGHIYRHTDGHQILFTLWAKSLQDSYGLVEADIKGMQDAFRYDGPFEEEVFTGDSLPYTRLAILLVLMTALFYLLRKRRMRGSPLQRYSDNRYWRCQCGRVNRTTVASCRQCGRVSPSLSITDDDNFPEPGRTDTNLSGSPDDQP